MRSTFRGTGTLLRRFGFASRRWLKLFRRTREGLGNVAPSGSLCRRRRVNAVSGAVVRSTCGTTDPSGFEPHSPKRRILSRAVATRSVNSPPGKAQGLRMWRFVALWRLGGGSRTDRIAEPCGVQGPTGKGGADSRTKKKGRPSMANERIGTCASLR